MRKLLEKSIRKLEEMQVSGMALEMI